MTDRWQMYRTAPMEVEQGWKVQTVTPPSRLAGANGITIGPDHRLYVAQVLGSQVTAIDVDSGEHRLFSRFGHGVDGPDDAIFGPDGTLYATETVMGRVAALAPDGSYRVVCDELPGANGITVDPEGRRLYIDEFRPGGRLIEIDPAGVAPPRTLLEDLNCPNALAMGPDRRLYFPQVFANEIWAFDLDSGQAELVVADVNVPTAVKFDSRGRIVIAEAGAGQITAIDWRNGQRETLAEVPVGIDNISVGVGDRIFASHYADGRVAEETGGIHRVLSEPGLIGPNAISPGRDGALIVSDALSVARIGADGRVVRLVVINLDLFTVAVGACQLGDDLAVLGLTGELLRYANGSRQSRVLVDGLEGPTALIPDGDGALIVERTAGRVTRLEPDGQRHDVATGLRAPGSVARHDEKVVITQGDGGTLVVLDSDGRHREIEGFANAQGVAVSGDTALVADAGRRQLVAVDLHSDRTTVIAREVPIGPPQEGFLLAAFSPVCSDGTGGFYVGCNGDGSIRRVQRAS
jgi:sugar lactone lactonase YvrE